MPAERVDKRRPLEQLSDMRRSSAVLLVVLTAVAASPGLAGPASRPASAEDRPATPAGGWHKPAVEPAVNPHGRPDKCDACHSETAGKVDGIPVVTMDAICLSCHDGQRAKRESHPIGGVFARKDLVLPQDWPLVNDKLSCATCHYMDDLSHNSPGPIDNPTWLRDFKRSDPLAFCAQCHLATRDHQRYNPHLMTNADGQVNERSCRFCHAVAQRPGVTARTHEPALLRSEPVLCMGCHQQHSDYFEPGHVGAKVGPKWKQQLVTAARLATSRPAGRRDDRLPLTDNDRIACSTCHNPHQAGVFPPGSPLGAGALSFDVTANVLREPDSYRGLGKELCHYCHGLQE